jgi:hypothetical protein
VKPSSSDPPSALPLSPPPPLASCHPVPSRPTFLEGSCAFCLAPCCADCCRFCTYLQVPMHHAFRGGAAADRQAKQRSRSRGSTLTSGPSCSCSCSSGQRSCPPQPGSAKKKPITRQLSGGRVAGGMLAMRLGHGRCSCSGLVQVNTDLLLGLVLRLSFLLGWHGALQPGGDGTGRSSLAASGRSARTLDRR